MNYDKKILLTGGAGYIGSNILVQLLNKNEKVIVIDNFSNSKITKLKEIKKKFKSKLEIFQIDILDKKKLSNLFKLNNIQTVIHLAALKSVRESFKKKKLYFKTNVEGTLNILNEMKKNNVNQLIFSSSATVYGNSIKTPFSENQTGKSTNPYGQSKIDAEKIIIKFCNQKNNSIKSVILRYFNPLGGNKKYKFGDVPKKNEDTLMNKLSRTITKKKIFKIYGKEYNTRDGTCIRDYVHVEDIAKGHLDSIKLFKNKNRVRIINLGSGKGYTVLEVIRVVEKILNKKINYKFVNKREGDVPISLAKIELAKKILNWNPSLGLYSMCKSHIEISL